MRIREYGLSMGELPTGKWNAITDVEGIRVGHKTIIKDSSHSVKDVVRTGITVVLPENIIRNPLYAGYFSLNGNGELCGSHWIEESGLLTSPIALTNTHSLGVVRDAIIKYYYEKENATESYWMLPVVAETWDGWLSDINGMHITAQDFYEALESAKTGPVTEGCVGGGTGMILHEFKGGIGTSSRIVEIHNKKYTVGVLIQGNYGRRQDLVIDNIPFGKFLPVSEIPGKEQAAGQKTPKEDGSIIIVIATDAPLLADQCKRLARRGAMGLARSGSFASDSSGDIFLAFSTHNHPLAAQSKNKVCTVETLCHEDMDALFSATVEATHEAIANALCAAVTTKGIYGRCMYSFPTERIPEIVKQFKSN